MKLFLSYLFCLLLLMSTCRSSLAKEGGDYGDTAPDFPTGEFSDGGHYHLSDFKGKILVLFFYEQLCPSCRATIAGRNKIVRRYSNEPVKFIGVGAGDSLDDVKSYIRETHLAMPVFADRHSKMEKSYGFKLSLHNIYQVRVISADGTVVGYDMQAATIDKALHLIKPEKTSERAETQSQNNSSKPAGDASATGQESASDTGNRQSQDSPATSNRRYLVQLNNEAVQAIKNNDNVTAIDKLKSILKNDSENKTAKENLKVAYSNYASELENQGKASEAEHTMRMAMELARELYRPEDRNYQSALEDYAGILSRMGRHKEAQEIMDKLKPQE